MVRQARGVSRGNYFKKASSLLLNSYKNQKPGMKPGLRKAIEITFSRAVVSLFCCREHIMYAYINAYRNVVKISFVPRQYYIKIIGIK